MGQNSLDGPFQHLIISSLWNPSGLNHQSILVITNFMMLMPNQPNYLMDDVIYSSTKTA